MHHLEISVTKSSVCEAEISHFPDNPWVFPATILFRHRAFSVRFTGSIIETDKMQDVTEVISYSCRIRFVCTGIECPKMSATSRALTTRRPRRTRNSSFVGTIVILANPSAEIVANKRRLITKIALDVRKREKDQRTSWGHSSAVENLCHAEH